MQLLAGITQFFAPSSPPPSNDTHRPNLTDSSSSIEGHEHENVEVSEQKSNANTESLSSNLLSRGNRTLGGTSNMRRREEDSSDEKRLFPTYNKTNKDVPIVPGQSVINNTRRNPIARFGPRPFDGITSRGKDSGPVRAYGSSSVAAHNNKHSANSRHPLSPCVSLDDGFGPFRRQYRPSSAIIELVTGEDNKQTAPKSVYRGRSPSVASVEAIEEPQTPTEPRFARSSRMNKSEANESSKSQHGSETFMEDAQINVDGIEDQNYATQPTFPHKKRRLDRSESPDELQGNVDFRTNSRPSNPYRSIFKPELPSDDERPKLIKGRKRLSSPNDIQPTVFNSSNKIFPRTNNRQNRPAASHKYLFEITLFRYDNIYWENCSAQLYFDEQSETFGLFSSGPTNPTAEIAVRRILKVLQGADESLKCRFNLSKTESSIYQHKVDVEFANSAERDRLCDLLKKKKSIVFQEKSKDWMDKAFQRAVELGPPREAQTSRIDNQILAESGNSVPIKRQKLSSSLQGENESLPGIKQPPRRLPLATMPPDTRKTPERNDEDEGVMIPVKTYRAPQKDWATRSKTRQSLIDLVENEPESPKAVRTSGDIWSKPLVYPPVGKKKAEVNSYDLTRLRDGEFLNDNLIGLYARFLEHYLERNNPEIARRVYFFNSYFYATLTNPGKGKKGINYQGVMKWTRNVDLFNHDYVIVPINENAHWYLAIICNLTVLKKRCQASDEQESKGERTEIDETAQKEIPETPASGDATTAGETARESLEMMRIEDVDVPSSDPREAPRSDNEWPEHEENNTTAATVLDSACGIDVGQSDKPEVHSAKKKKPKSFGPVYAVDQPTVITFDSLNESRANTIKILKQYLLEESGKAGLTFEPKDIKGMTAKGIPLQPNYSDCGLYLLAYLEKFVQDPYTFVRSILRREMKTQTDWPTLQSGLLRRRLRIFLHRLYREQETGRETPLLVDVEPISYLLDPSSAGPLRSPKGVEAVTVEVGFVPDSFEEKEKGLDEKKSEVDVQSVVEETQFSQQSSKAGGEHEPTSTDKPEPKEDHVEDIVALPATPDRAVSADAKEPGLPVHQPDRVAETTEVSPDSDSKAQESVNIFDEIRDYIIQGSPPRRIIEVQVPTVQVPRTPPSNKISKTRNALRKGRPKEPL